MNILFLTIAKITDITKRGIYEDLMRKFLNEGHHVFIVTPSERRYNEKTELFQKDNLTILRIKTLNIQKTNLFEKGLSTLLIEYQFLNAIKKFFREIHVDLVLYSTPPITFTGVIKYIKYKNGAISYLLLKDIFPQNAVDLGMIKKNGILHRYFRQKEKELYSLSDYIGCMSPANVSYICEHNPSINPVCVDVNPNSLEPIKMQMNQDEKYLLRKKYNIPIGITTFIYGGNLGKPQGIDFLIQILDSQISNINAYYVIIGAGTEFGKLQSWFNLKKPNNACLLSILPRVEFDKLIQCCDVGMIFLDKRFTIPNFPSRLLSYLENRMPVIAATDKNTDIGSIIQANSFGFWSEAEDIEKFKENINRLTQNEVIRIEMGQRGYDYFLENYNITKSYNTIINCILRKKQYDKYANTNHE